MSGININGLWSVDFMGPAQSYGAGIIVFQNGKILGGDGSYFYTGDYSLTGNLLKASTLSKHYRGPMDNIFGPLSEVSLILEGAVSDPFIMGQGFDPKYPSRKMSFKLQRLSN